MNGFQALLTFLGVLVIVVGDRDLIEKYTRATGNVYHGRYTRDVHEPEFLVPRRVFEDGSFHTYSLPNFYDRREIAERGKRSAEAGEKEPETDKLHLVLPFNGIEHHVELDPHHEFISPDMVIETRGAGLSSNLNEAIRFKRAPDQQCHYRGFAGYVQTDHGRYFIEPAHQAEPESDGRHVHIAYERSIPHGGHGKDDHAPRRTCGTSDNWEAAWAEALAHREKRLSQGNSLASKRETHLGVTHSIHRYLTVALVADRMFLDFHNNTNYEQYLLTITNMAADYYHDVSTGNQIDLILVRMIYLEKEKEETDLRISPAAEEALDSFLKWAHKLKPKDENHPNHFDAAVLITRYDICSEGTECGLLGLAYVGAICIEHRGGSINEDNGLALGIVVAHELGHTLGCGHDEGGPNACDSQDSTDSSYYVMAPVCKYFTIRWSPCSRKFMTELFDQGLGDCLSNSPRNPPQDFKFPEMLPGAMYDADFQCQMVYPGSKRCTNMGAFTCEKLWCNVNNSCFSRGHSLADGTKCGENKWCIHKQCVEMGTRPKAVHGGWGSWSPMGSCSRTCGGGLKYSERECDKPTPANGGRYCIGERKRLTICNTQPCDPSKPPFRAVQCSSYDTVKKMSDGLHTWKPILDKNALCALYCVNEKNQKMKLARVANDTTPCRPGTNDMCVAGICRKVSCDWILDGTAVEDKCGICKGDGTKCKKIEGLFNATTSTSPRDEIVRIPKGATSITVAELLKKMNILSYAFFGYNAYRRFEVIYTYYVPSANPSYTPKYLWDFTEWTNCDVKCGGGTMISEAACIEENGGKVTPVFCQSMPKPEAKSRVCNMEPCPAKWRVSQWSRCSACDGKTGWKHRKVQCVKPASRSGEDDVQANFDACKGRVPKQKEECVGKRPCKKTCPKATRNVDKNQETAKGMMSVPMEKRAEMIDAVVDLSLARYLGKVYGVSSDEDELGRMSDWTDTEDEKMKRSTTCTPGKNITTPRPGSFVKDHEPVESVVLQEAPYLNENLQQNLSDLAYQQSGDRVGVSLDTAHEKVYQGEEAIKKMQQLTGQNETRVAASPPTNGNEKLTYDRLARLVDPENQR
nr:A disintegrin and metalloproteinase with thrombospondin motifs 7-like [Nomia melanderi]